MVPVRPLASSTLSELIVGGLEEDQLANATVSSGDGSVIVRMSPGLTGWPFGWELSSGINESPMPLSPTVIFCLVPDKATACAPSKSGRKSARSNTAPYKG